MVFSNILLIDDDDDDQEIFLMALQQISSTITYNYYNSAREALAQLAVSKQLPEVIFLDLNMPLMSGQEFLFHIKQNQVLAPIPVIIFSTASDDATKVLTKDLGAYDFITKPSDFNELINLLRPLIR
ncbi:response regulator [Emticicia agri]|uniref:Response regulator n=1 Tax=Emticicia agri TaxID=2492393 RepID=A0A4Q5LV75_9BACT|nr:response regulator [Emticicia agri]RYU93439.1 response regulator [Emticicia agri]